MRQEIGCRWRNFSVSVGVVSSARSQPLLIVHIFVRAGVLKQNIRLELGSTATAYEPYYDGGTATAEMLLKLNSYQDVQSILDGVVTRNIGIKVLGTENWTLSTVANTYFSRQFNTR